VQKGKQKHKSNARYFREDKTVVMPAVPAESFQTGDLTIFAVSYLEVSSLLFIFTHWTQHFSHCLKIFCNVIFMTLTPPAFEIESSRYAQFFVPLTGFLSTKLSSPKWAIPKSTSDCSVKRNALP